MECKDVMNLLTIIVMPIVAVLIGQWLQNRSEKRKDKMYIFKTLMTSRIYGWTADSVHCQNIIDIVFADDKNVRNAWKDLYDKYCVQNPDETQLKKIENAKYMLLEAMAISLGYKDKITWQTIQNPYIPDGIIEQIKSQNQIQQAWSEILMNMLQMMSQNNKVAENNEQQYGKTENK